MNPFEFAVYTGNYILLMATFISGIVAIILNKQISIPVWGIILIWLGLLALEMFFFMLFVKLEMIEDEEEQKERKKSSKIEETEDEIIERELRELHEFNELKRKYARDNPTDNGS